MTIPISTIVDVQITRQTLAVSQQSFGTPLVLGEHSLFTERIKFVSDLAGVLALGFTTSDVEYRLAQAVFAQDLKPNRLAIGRKAANVQGVLRVQFSANFVSGNTINMSVGGLAIPAVPFDTSNDLTFTDLEIAIATLTSVVGTVTSNDTARYVDITFVQGVDPVVSDVIVTGGASQATSTVTPQVAAVTYATELDKLVLESEDWYCLLMESTLEKDILSASAWIESHSPTKILAVRSNAAGILDSTISNDVASLLQDKGLDRTFLSYHNVANEYVDGAIIGRMLPEDPGSATFKFKSLNLVSPDNLRQDQVINAQDKNANLYQQVGGVGIFMEGKMAGGEFIDTIIGTDWLQARMQERIYRLLTTLKKVPYTDAGVALIENEIRAQLDEAIVRGFIAAAPAYTVTVPKVASVNPNDRANRYLPDIKFSATLAGAIHKVQIRGVVTI